jgi:hypothetical protein
MYAAPSHYRPDVGVLVELLQSVAQLVLEVGLTPLHQVTLEHAALTHTHIVNARQPNRQCGTSIILPAPPTAAGVDIWPALRPFVLRRHRPTAFVCMPNQVIPTLPCRPLRGSRGA